MIADRLSLLVNEMYGNVPQHSGSQLLLATVFFSFQIYCDFSGYSDIAIGSAKVMGFHLMTNFNNPYKAVSISEFWKKWHISLSTWFKDYLYITMGGNRVSVPKWYFNLFIVFLISGIWHGANWTFVVWGSLHGFYLIATLIRDHTWPKIKMHRYFNRLVTFLLVSFAWIFFRSENISIAWQVIKKIFTFSNYNVITSDKLNSTEILFSIALIVLLMFKDNYLPKIKTASTPRFYLLLAVFFVVIYFFGVFNSNSFIYFQF